MTTTGTRGEQPTSRRERGDRRVLLASVAIMAAVSVAVAGVVLYALYAAAFREAGSRLTEVVQSRARIIEAVVRFNSRYIREDVPGGAAAATLEQVVEGHEEFEGFGRTGEFQLARLEGERMVFLVRQRHGGSSIPRVIPLQSGLAEPMRRALRGEAGIVVGPDYRGVRVLAAYDSVRTLSWGVVAKIDLAEIRTPFVRAGLLAGAIALLISASGTWLVARLIAALLGRVEERTRQLQAEIGEREEAENALRQSEERLREAQKLEAIAHLASGIAHDFNNLLTVILASSEALERRLPEGGRERIDVSRIQQATAQARSVTHSLLTFGRNMPVERRVVKLQALLDENVSLLRHLLPAGIELIMERLESGDCWVHADPHQLQQVLLNLGVNARDAMPSGGTLRVTLATASDRHDAEGAPGAGVPPGFVRLTVNDTGVGILPEHRQRIFEPFFTTKPRGQGTGLGLSIVHGIVTEHGGRIAVDSQPGCGTRFSVDLPRVSPPAPQEKVGARLERRVPRTGERILLAEEHDQVRAALASTLESLGYEVVTAADEAGLLKRLAEQGTDVALLVVDLDLPGGRGLAYLSHLRAIGADAPALVLTGEPVNARDPWVGPDDRLLRKPFSMGEFAELVGKLLESRRMKETHHE